MSGKLCQAAGEDGEARDNSLSSKEGKLLRTSKVTRRSPFFNFSTLPSGESFRTIDDVTRRFGN
jgi:hypothetical protein